MFKTDKLIYIQMQKTACTHIGSLLSGLFDGVHVGKHRAASDHQIKSDFYFISSIRNPWDWYLSLWTYGIHGSGGLRGRLTRRKYRKALRDSLRHPIRNRGSFLAEASKDVSSWRAVYDRADNVESFRKWLKLIHDPCNADRLGEDYGSSVVGGFCGFMSYRYLYLCCSDPVLLKNHEAISDYEDLVQYEEKHCYIDFFIRQESLEDDFLKAVEKIRPLNQEERNRIFGAKKANTSHRPLTLSDYYDQEAIDLVHQRDRLLIEKFGYSPPVASV